MLVVDETGDVKKGTAHRRRPAPVHRHRRADRERPGRGLPGLRRPAAGHAPIDRELYLPRSWTGDPDRCRAAGPRGHRFATKPELAGTMIDRLLDAGDRSRWVAGDEVYGGNPTCAALEERGIGYVLAVACATKCPPAPTTRSAPTLAAGAEAGLAEALGRDAAPRATASTTGPSSTITDSPARATSCC